MISKKSQSVIEFVIMFGFILFFFIVFFSIIQGNEGEKNKEKERIIAQNIALDVQEEISLAAKASEGYRREFKIPENILGNDYEINISDGLIYVRSKNAGTSYKIYNVTGIIKRGLNFIKKENGSVYLN